MSISLDKVPLLVTCHRGFEAQALQELASLGGEKFQVLGGAVRCWADFESAMRYCLWARQINKVQVILAEGYFKNEASLYELAYQLPLEPFFSPDLTFCVRVNTNEARFKNPLILALKLKDGLVDQMYQRWSRRASVDTQKPDMTLSLQLIDKRMRVMLELQGQALHKRGYRRRQAEAPISETLAAAILAFSNYTATRPLCDPLCGSGTFIIEAALQALDIAPGLQRRFAFEDLPCFGDFRVSWNALREEAKTRAREGRRQLDLELFASDIDGTCIEMAKNNAQTAGVDRYIQFKIQNVLELSPFNADLIMNPPYGERIQIDGMPLEEFYYQLGRHLRHFHGSQLSIIADHQLLKKQLHLRPFERISTYNGPIACEVAKYQLGKR